jgi:hypothetical protein
MRFLILLRRKDRVWEEPGLDAIFVLYFLHGLGIELWHPVYLIHMIMLITCLRDPKFC